jgi:hypothetical protein
MFVVINTNWIVGIPQRLLVLQRAVAAAKGSTRNSGEPDGEGVHGHRGGPDHPTVSCRHSSHSF